MARRDVAFWCCLLFVALLVPSAAAQEAGWQVPRTPWGDPDLRGTFTNKTITPLQRPVELADREFLTEEEAATIEQERIARALLEEPPVPERMTVTLGDEEIPFKIWHGEHLPGRHHGGRRRPR